jgi:hypothetical protein
MMRCCNEIKRSLYKVHVEEVERLAMLRTPRISETSAVASIPLPRRDIAETRKESRTLVVMTMYRVAYYSKSANVQ